MLQDTLANDGDAFKVVLVLHAEAEVVQCGVQVPAVKICQLQQYRNSTVHLDEFLQARKECLVVCMAELAAEEECNDVVFLDR